MNKLIGENMMNSVYLCCENNKITHYMYHKSVIDDIIMICYKKYPDSIDMR